MTYTDASAKQIDNIMHAAWNAWHDYRNSSLSARNQLLHAIANELAKDADTLISTAMMESHLPEARLQGELKRTIFQLTSYGDACERGDWLNARIDTADASKTPPKPDIRKSMMALGPVVVFGASNFPFAYSTAGGDTASALAAGCPVVIKAHGAHAETSQLVADCIARAVRQQGLPEGIFGHVHGQSYEVGKQLVMHDYTSAVGFTGSYAGGKQLFDWANQRKVPIPVFAEMGSINPVFLLPEKLKSATAEIAKMYAASITLNVGQFCTNPGLIIGIKGKALDDFLQQLGEVIEDVAPAPMLHDGIAKSFHENRKEALDQKGVQLVSEAKEKAQPNEGIPTIATTTVEQFLENPALHKEVFGPYSLLVQCNDAEEMLAAAKACEGQLTSTIMATERDFAAHTTLVEAVKNICGRLIMNGVPTGVDVSLSQHHGGPFPATTDSRFTAVGGDAINRFARPIAYQNWPDNLLPDEIKNGNPLGIWRTVNNELTKNAIS